MSVKFLLRFHKRLSTFYYLLAARSVSKPCARVIFSYLALIPRTYVRQEETYKTLMTDGTIPEI
jgi:hypothetical protein